MTVVCPCCGFSFGNPQAAHVVSAKAIGGYQRRIAERLVQKFGMFVSSRDLAEYCYSRLPSGGPDDAPNCIKQQIHHLKKRLQPELAIKSHHRSGYKMVWA